MNSHNKDWPNPGDWFLYHFNLKQNEICLRRVISVNYKDLNGFSADNFCWTKDEIYNPGTTGSYYYRRSNAEPITAEEAEELMAIFALQG